MYEEKAVYLYRGLYTFCIYFSDEPELFVTQYFNIFYLSLVLQFL